ncbi:MAG: glycoside hydrolase family 13 protein [Acutalibacter sp.]|nr:glycoside hydrolase family 13 protein [Acutalibacter sp.]
MFHSRSIEYKDPVGAVPAGTAVHFRITLPRDLSCSAAQLIVEQEGVGYLTSDMFWCGMNGDDREWWECHFTPEKAGLYFYYFGISTNRGNLRLSKGDFGKAVLGGTERWQMTVHSPDLETPEWLLGGVMYQIFPDRFACSGETKENVPAGRSFHSDWFDQPEWRPNQQGKVTNSDFFGGDLKGVQEKLPYLKNLGVTCIYFNPIFESHSNHRYDTADYSKIDPLLGTEQEFSELCNAAEKLGIRILLDGVFSHTGSDSVYFNREGRYVGPGAYQFQSSPYFSWYSFRSWPQSYDCWWNFETLPNVQETDPSYDNYINGREGIVRKWLRAGAAGWRLDVADELPDEFLDSLAKAAKSEKEDALVLGEVWEDASNKSAYGVRRRYLLGGQLDTVMNYPFRDAIFDFLLGREPSVFAETVESIVENYPAQSLHLLMNHIGTHDTERALTVLGGEPAGGREREWQSAQSLSPEQRELGKKRLKLASLLQYLLPGIPCLYYGDEAGMEGYRDPFNRACYPWGNEDQDLLSWYEGLGKLRTEQKSILAQGGYRTLLAEGNLLAFERFAETDNGTDSLILVVNRSDCVQNVPRHIFPEERLEALLGENLTARQSLLPFGFSLMKFHQVPEESHEAGKTS